MPTSTQFMQALPADFAQLAFETGAFTRARKIQNPAQLMQLIMLYSGQDLSLRSCAGQFAHAHGALSDMGVKKD
jgi:hypothetical protein